MLDIGGRVGNTIRMTLLAFLVLQEAPLPPAEAARTMVVPDGFRVTLFAGEPDVCQPISFCIDDRGRLWVAEAYNYPQRGGEGRDRVVILEDTDGDGTFNTRRVFCEGLSYITGIEVGFGGVWAVCPPQMIFIPDADGDDRPDGAPRVLLDGFGVGFSAHNIANGFTWGPDGWLYGGHGRTSPGDIGKPGAPASDRVHFDGGVFRYHPTRHVFEAFADGFTNAWGVDFDDYGQAFVSNCVTPHLYHVIPGGHYEPWRNRPSSEHAYQRLPPVADHLHWTGSKPEESRGGTAEQVALGGGHAHSGTLVYLGDQFPASYRNTVLMCNIHGKRMNNDRLVRSGSGYVATHGPDLMVSRDPWFMGVTIRAGPDGSVFVSDWSDTGECHSMKNTRRETGRIFKVSYGTPKFMKVDVAKASDAELVALQLHRNDWWVRHARRVLQERAAGGPVHAALKGMFRDQKDVTRILRALWALVVTGGADEPFLRAALEHDSEHVRGWAVRLLGPAGADRYVAMARGDASPVVRLEIASVLQRLPLERRWGIIEELVVRPEDAADANLPLMTWYGLEPLVALDRARAATLIPRCKSPVIQQFIARRAASAGK